MDRLEELKTKFADELAKLEVVVNGVYQNKGRSKWFRERETGKDPTAFKEAIEYLELRGLLERHPDDSSLVRVKEAEPAK